MGELKLDLIRVILNRIIVNVNGSVLDVELIFSVIPCELLVDYRVASPERPNLLIILQTLVFSKRAGDLLIGQIVHLLVGPGVQRALLGVVD